IGHHLRDRFRLQPAPVLERGRRSSSRPGGLQAMPSRPRRDDTESPRFPPASARSIHTIAALAQALQPSPYSVMKNASATAGNARPTHAASGHPPSAYAQPPSAEPTAQPMKKAAT